VVERKKPGKAKGKKELPMGQAVTDKFPLIVALSLGYDSNRNYRGILTMIL
jgi:hypothetical protein